jgi:hypothetical protein
LKITAFFIDLFDFFEEICALSSGESLLHDSCRSKLAEFVLDRAARWKQHGKFWAIAKGDENTRFSMLALCSACIEMPSVPSTLMARSSSRMRQSRKGGSPVLLLSIPAQVRAGHFMGFRHRHALLRQTLFSAR